MVQVLLSDPLSFCWLWFFLVNLQGHSLNLTLCVFKHLCPSWLEVRGSTGGHKPKRCGQRGEPRWAEPRRWWPPRGWAEGSPAPPAHTPYMCYISYSHKEHLTPFLPYRLFFFLNNQSPLSLFSVPHLWLSENLRNLSFFTRFTNSFLIYFKLSKWLAQDLNN